MFNFLIAPDFPPEFFAGWHFLNTRLQRTLDEQVHLLTPASANEVKAELEKDNVDLIYANPFDAAYLVRERGFLPVARPVSRPDEMVIASQADGKIKVLEDLKPGCTVACTANYDVRLIGLRLLEAVDLEDADINWQATDSFPAVARKLIRGEVDAGFFMASAFHSLTELTRSQLNVLIESNINDLSHVLLVSSRLADKQEMLQQGFSHLKEAEGGQHVLNELGLSDGFEVLHQEDVEFLIDLIETLRD